mmetsp:Transcript_48106/g.96865  ORF Transcript_48106/g.96865 Transcript_48106/m.96865 type:complete len:254 (-) Transcript_48106:242-1003(-)
MGTSSLSIAPWSPPPALPLSLCSVSRLSFFHCAMRPRRSSVRAEPAWKCSQFVSKARARRLPRLTPAAAITWGHVDNGEDDEEDEEVEVDLDLSRKEEEIMLVLVGSSLLLSLLPSVLLWLACLIGPRSFTRWARSDLPSQALEARPDVSTKSTPSSPNVASNATAPSASPSPALSAPRFFGSFFGSAHTSKARWNVTVTARQRWWRSSPCCCCCCFIGAGSAGGGGGVFWLAAAAAAALAVAVTAAVVVAVV